MARLLGVRNEAEITLEGEVCRALVDTGAQLSTINLSFVQNLGLPIHRIDRLRLQGTGGETVPFLGYVEINLGIPEIAAFDEDVLMLVIPDNSYNKKVPVQLGILHIDRALELATEEELKGLDQNWQRGRLASNLSARTAALITDDSEFNLDKVDGTVKLTKSIQIAPHQTVHVQGLSKVRGHDKRVNTITEPLESSKSIVAVPSYSILKPGSSKVQVCLQNLSNTPIKLKAKTVVARVAAANVVPAMLAPNLDNDEMSGSQKIEKNETQPKLTQEQLGTLFSKVDLSGIEEWSEDEQSDVRALITEYGNLFALESLDLGKTSVVKHHIKLEDYTPFKERYRRIPPHQFEEVKKHLQEMLDLGAIRRSSSPWASAVVLVRKKDGSLRFCIDLRKLNAKTIKDAYGLPRIDETLDCLNGAQWFTSLDLKSGYWQVELDEESKPLTAFTVGPLGFYECERMPFGLTNAPATFQRLMETCLGELHLTWCIIYLDDIIVFSKTPREQIERLRGVFEKLAAAGLKLKPSKCEFFKTRIAYLGHIVSKDGIETDPKKIAAIANWPIPVTVTDVRSFLGFTNHYRRFIHKYAHIARPLNLLVSGENSNKKKKAVEWNPECNEAFNKLRDLCSHAPILAYADYSKPFRLHTDASELGLGAVLYQTSDDGKERVIAYGSRTLSKSERNYCAYKLEFLALKWAVTERFHEYLYGASFDVYTDNNPLTYILTSAKLDATGQRWVASLANYNFQLHYKSGKTNVEADALSRIPWENATLDEATVKAIMDVGTAGHSALFEAYTAEQLPEDCCQYVAQCNALTVANTDVPDALTMIPEEWAAEQYEDSNIGEIYRAVVSKKLFHRKSNKNDSDEVRAMLRHRKGFVLRNHMLYRKVQISNRDQPSLQFVLPAKFRLQAMEACHNDIGHLGVERSLDLLKDRFYWAGMAKDMENHIKSCDRCLRFKAKPHKTELHPILATHPMELVHIDYLTIESGKTDKDINVLVVTDHFTRYAQAYVTKTQTAKVVAQTLWDRYFMHYGLPEKILSDQGRNFESNLIAELCELSKVKKLRTTPYRPQTNGQCERFNSTLISMLGTLPNEAKADWPNQVMTLVHAYNCTKSNATGFSPYYLLYGRQPMLPIDIQFGVRTPDLAETTTHKYVQKLKKRFQWAYQRAKEVNDKEIKRHKRRYDRNVRCSKLETGDLVLVRQKAFKGKHKIQDRWENTPYMILEQTRPGLPVYRVQLQGENAKTRVLHRNMLFPLLPNQESEENVETVEDRDENPVEAIIPETTENETDDDIGDDPTEEQSYSGPVTRSRAKAQEPVNALVKANLLMEEHFDNVEETSKQDSSLTTKILCSIKSLLLNY